MVHIANSFRSRSNNSCYGFCETYHAGDEAYSDKIWYWRTPIEQCLDGRTDVTCTDYSDWTKAWTEIKG